jgi:hypothetical protein
MIVISGPSQVIAELAIAKGRRCSDVGRGG